MITLTKQECHDYSTFVLPTLKKACQGTVLFFRDFFPGRSASPRIAQFLFQQVKAGLIPGVVLNGDTSREGYLIEPD